MLVFLTFHNTTCGTIVQWLEQKTHKQELVSAAVLIATRICSWNFDSLALKPQATGKVVVVKMLLHLTTI